MKTKLVYVNICNTEMNFEDYPALMFKQTVTFNLGSDWQNKEILEQM